ncbi:serine/threonine-protein kinase meng-po [Phlebotomus argentipes]|uniref:serine/threonine-protein kinase meng-po n=1 Tax=Phlebotomus argentipes TaxID=94469 RepID=UPI002892F327|nr:serine/threonine-protein kinase meng-po [Phlebotomus argentipes]
MNTNRKNIGHIHRVREFELEKVSLADEFDILQIVGEGWFGKILLVEHKATDMEMVLKALPKPYVSLRDFYREFHFGLHLGAHKNIVTTYDVAFETAGFYVFTQEYAPLGDLTSNVLDTGIGEIHSKKVAKQIASALDYMHFRDIVHRDVKLDNVLVFKSDFSRVKLCDFGESRRINASVQRRNEWLAYSPPEVLAVRTDDTYKTNPSHDVWQFAIVVFVCLTGCLPWQKAAQDDPRYVRYYAWHTSNLAFPLKRQPKLFKLVSARASKMFRKFLEPRFERRPKSLSELSKFLDDRWLAKGAEKEISSNEPDELCPSMYSFHSSPEEKNKLLSALAEAGIETTVDRVAKKARIRDWIQSSVITEEDEEEDDSGTNTPSSTMSRTPVAGHVSSVKAEEQQQEQKYNSTVKDASKKHIDPRTGMIQNGPSEMRASEQIIEDQAQDVKKEVPNGVKMNGNHAEDVDRRMSVASTGSTMQTMVNARLEIPMKGPSNNIRTYNETQNYSSRSLKNNANDRGPISKGIMSTIRSFANATVPELANSFAAAGKGQKEKDPENAAPTVISPVAVKRSSVRSSDSGGSLLINNSSSSKDPSPFDSDDIESSRGSTGFVNLVGSSTAMTSSMKDTPYDRVVPKQKKK